MIRIIRGFLLSFLALFLGFVVLRWGGWLTVQAVKISPTRYVAVEKLTGPILGANILRLTLEPLRQEILADPRVLAVVSRVNFFALRVEIEVRERTPLLAVELTNGEKVWVDQEGVILEEAKEASVVGVQAEGGRVGKDVVEAGLSWERLPSGLRARYPKLDLSAGSARAPGSPTIIFGIICHIPQKLGILTALWQEGWLAEYQFVDLRANDVVILKRRGR